MIYIIFPLSSYKEKSPYNSKELSYNGKYEIDSNSNILSNTKTFLMLFLEIKNRDNVTVKIKLNRDDKFYVIYIVRLKKESLTIKNQT